MVECLPGIYEASGLIPSSLKSKQQNKDDDDDDDDKITKKCMAVNLIT